MLEESQKEEFSINNAEELRFSSDKIKSKMLIHSNFIFDLYSGIAYLGESDKEVIILHLKPINFDLKILDQIASYVAKFEKESSDDEGIHDFFLKRVGCYNIDKKFYLVYEKGDSKHFDIDEILGNCDDVSIRLTALIFWSKTLIHKLSNLNDCGFKLGLIHPGLIFYSLNDNCLKMIDYIFPCLFEEYDFQSNLEISLFFGSLDLKTISELFSEKLSVQNDLILFLVFLVFILSKSIHPNKKATQYNQIIYLLKKDFYMGIKQNQFPNFLNFIENEEIKEFLISSITKVLNSKSTSSSLNQDIQQFLFQLNEGKKCEGTDRCKGGVNNLNLNCLHFLCRSCFHTHTCSEEGEVKEGKSKLPKDYGVLMNKINQLKATAANIVFPKQTFFNFFKKNVFKTFRKIIETHEKYEIFLFMNETKINHMIDAVEKILRKKNERDFDEIKKLKDELKEEVTEIIEKATEAIKKQNLDYKKRYEEEKKKLDIENKSVSSKISKISKSSKREVEIEIEKKKSIFEGLLDQNDSYYEEVFKMFHDLDISIREYDKYLDNNKKLNMQLNYNINLSSLMSRIIDISSHFLEDLTYPTYNNLSKEFDDYSDEVLVKKYKEIYNPDGEPTIFDELEHNRSLLLATAELKQNVVIIFDVEEKKEKKYKLVFPEDYKISSINAYCRWVNLKTRLVITGGTYKSDLNEDPTNCCFYIDFEEDSTRERNVQVLKDMITERDQHCMISIDEFKILCISGSRTEKCEMYNLLTDEWTPVASLNQPRYNCSAFVQNGLVVYLFYGLLGPPSGKNQMTFCDHILRLKLYSQNGNPLVWEKIDYQGERLNLCLTGTILVSEKEIYIMGGRIPGENNYSNLNYVFDPTTYTISQSKVILPKKLCFLESCFIQTINEDFALYSSDFTLVKLKF